MSASRTWSLSRKKFLTHFQNRVILYTWKLENFRVEFDFFTLLELIRNLSLDFFSEQTSSRCPVIFGCNNSILFALFYIIIEVFHKSPCCYISQWARKKVPAKKKKVAKSNKSIARNSFWPNFIFYNFKNGQINFWTRKKI